MEFKGKACIVTGGSRGIGKAITESLLKRGAKVLFVDILYKDGEATLEEFTSKYGSSNVSFMRVDVASHTNFEMAFLRCRDLFGTIDVLVNNAGINAETSWETQVDINLKGTIRGCQLAFRYMGKNGREGESSKKGGVVLNVSSIQGLMSWPAMPSYSAAKAGIIQYTKCAGHDVEYGRHGVRLLCLCPFGVITPMQDFEVYTGMSKEGQEYLASMDVKGNILTAEDVGENACNILSTGKTTSVWYIHKHGMDAWEVEDTNGWENLMKNQPK